MQDQQEELHAHACLFPIATTKKQERSLVDMDVASFLASNIHEIDEMLSLYDQSESAFSISRLLQNTAPLADDASASAMDRRPLSTM